MGEEGDRPPGRDSQGPAALLTPGMGASKRQGRQPPPCTPAWPLTPLQWLPCTALLLSPCSLQHNTIKEEGATFLAEALLTNHRLMTLQ